MAIIWLVYWHDTGSVQAISRLHLAIAREVYEWRNDTQLRGEQTRDRGWKRLTETRWRGTRVDERPASQRW